MPSQAANLTALRKSGHRLRGYGSFFTPSVVWQATVNTTPADGALALAVTSVSGAHTAAAGGFRVDVFTSGGAYKGRTRVRYNASITSTSLPIREHSQGTVKITAGDTVKVYGEVRLSDKLTAANETFAPEHETFSAQTSNPGPIACSGGHWAGDTSMLPIQMTGDTSDWVDPDSNGPLTHLWTLPTGLSFHTGSANSDANPQLTGDPGSYLVRHDVTDADNSVTTTQWVMVVIDDTPYDVFLDSLDYDEQTGWSGSPRFKDAISLDDVADGSYFFFWVKETIDGTRQSFGAASPGRSHIKLAGILRRDEASGDARDDELTFEVISPMARLAELVGYSKVMTNTATPDSWQKVKTLGIERAIRLLLLHYTNLVEAGFDVITHTSWSDALYSQLFLNKSTPYGQVMELADGRDGRFVCDRSGRFELQRRLDLLPLASRAGQTTTIALNDDDITGDDGYRLRREHWEPVEFLRTRGFTAGATTSSNAPVFSKWPGTSPGFGNEDTTEDKLIVDSVADNYARNGRRGARRNRIYVDTNGVWRKAPELDITLFGSYDVIDPANAEWIQFDVGAVANLRGTAVSDFRWIARRVSVSYEGGTARTRLTLDAETHGEPGVDDTPPPESSTGFDPGSWTPGDWTFPPWTGTVPDIPPYGGLVPGLKRLARVLSNGHLRRTTNFERSSALGGPSWDDVDLSGTLGSTVLQWCYDARSNASGTHGWVLTPTAIYKINNIWGTPTATLQHTFATSSNTRNIDFDYIHSPGLFGGILTNYGTTGVKVTVTTDGGATWSTEAFITASGRYIDSSQLALLVPGFLIDPTTAGRVYAGATDEVIPTSDWSYLFRNDGGGAWAKQTQIKDDEAYLTSFIIPFGPSSSRTGYHGYTNLEGFGGAIRNTVMRADINVSDTDIGAVVSGTYYGPDWQRSRFGMSIPGSNPLRLTYCGIDIGRTKRGVFTTANAEAVTVAWSTLIAPSASVPYTRCAQVDDSELYVFGLNGAIAFSGDGGTTFDDRTGNSLDSAEVVGITG